MTGNVNSAVVSFIVLSRGLGCIDDTATDEEQYEKIVYYYPETTPISRQLQTTNMCEGLIDFSTRFAENEDVDTVVMKEVTYGFKKCEADLWLIAAISNHTEVVGTRGVSEVGLQRLLTQAYEAYFMQHGDVQSDLQGMHDHGSQNIQQTKALRKAIRKLNRKIDEIEDDLLHADESTTLEATEARAQRKRDHLQERRGLEGQLEDLVVYSPIVRMRKRWQALMRWYLQAQDFSNINSLHSFSGVHYHTLNASEFRKISRTVFSLKEQTRSLGLKACTVMYEGAVIWNELDEKTLLSLYEFISLNEYLKIPAQADRRASRKHKSIGQRVRAELSAMQQQEKPFTISEQEGDEYQSFNKKRSPSEDGSDSQNWKSEIAAAMRQRSDRKGRGPEVKEEQTATGFIGNGWAVLDDKFSQLRTMPEVQTAIFSEYCVGAQGMWCPRIYAHNRDATVATVDEDVALAFEYSRGLLGRLILYRLGSYLFILLMDESAISECKRPPSSTATSPASDVSTAPVSTRAAPSSNVPSSPRSSREGSVTVRSVQPICASIRTSLAAATTDLQGIAQPDTDWSEPDAGVKLLYVNQCNCSFRAIDVGSKQGMNSIQFPLQASLLAKHIPDHFLTCIDDALECFVQKNSPDSYFSYCVRATSGDWLFARSQGGRQVYTLVSDQSFFQEAYDSVMNASRRIMRGIVF